MSNYVNQVRINPLRNYAQLFRSRQNACLYKGPVKGVTFRAEENERCYAYLLEHRLSPEVKLVHEIENVYDKNAIKVLIGQGPTFFHVGYVPKESAGSIHSIGVPNVEARYVDLNYYGDTVVGWTIEILPKTPMGQPLI